MRRFLVNTTWFCLPVLLIALLMEFSLRQIPNDYRFKKNYLDSNATKINTLILGNSHALYGIDPAFLTISAFNASHVSQSLDYDFEILKKYENRLINLKTIIIPISYFTFYKTLASDIESWRIKNYVLYYQMNKAQSYENYSELLSNEFTLNVKRIGSYFIKGKVPVYCSELGWGNDFKSELSRDLLETGKSSAIKHTMNNIHSDKNLGIFKENTRVLDSIIDWSAKRNIKVVFITTPAFLTYRRDLNQDQLKVTIQTITEIASLHSNCNYVNLLNDTTFAAGDYFDADHLSEIGAKKLSGRIDSMIANPQ